MKKVGEQVFLMHI